MQINIINKFKSKHYLIFLLIFSFSNYSCYYYAEVSSQDFHNKNYTSNIKIVKNDKSELEFKSGNVEIKDSTLIINQGPVQRSIPFSDIDKYYQERFDILATIMVVPLVIILSGAVLAFLGPKIKFD